MNKYKVKNSKDDSYYVLSRPELKQLLPKSLTGMTILEIGCGAGNFIHNISSCKEYWGVEPNYAMAQQAKKKLNFVLIGSFREVETKIPPNNFDLIVCNDVIEHMDDVDYFLALIKTKLKRNGSIIGSVPNVRFIENILRFLIQRDWKYTEWGILDKTHLRFFTEKSLHRLFLQNGYKIEILRRINPVVLKYASIKSFVLNLILLVFGNLMGRDSLYYQFGFKITPLKYSNRNKLTHIE
jgi:2-polyprenyl-3-methyl-5-hydroxy-6-metoxy-1,4-benzoquinol methylase